MGEDSPDLVVQRHIGVNHGPAETDAVHEVVLGCPGKALAVFPGSDGVIGQCPVVKVGDIALFRIRAGQRHENQKSKYQYNNNINASVLHVFSLELEVDEGAVGRVHDEDHGQDEKTDDQDFLQDVETCFFNIILIEAENPPVPEQGRT